MFPFHSKCVLFGKLHFSHSGVFENNRQDNSKFNALLCAYGLRNLMILRWTLWCEHFLLPSRMQVASGNHCSDPHVLDLWCVICGATSVSCFLSNLIVHQDFCTAFCIRMAYLFWHFANIPKIILFQAYRGIRIGEAKNPGPKRKVVSNRLNFAVINPQSSTKLVPFCLCETSIISMFLRCQKPQLLPQRKKL